MEKKKYDKTEEEEEGRKKDLFEEKIQFPSLMQASSEKAKENQRDSFKLPPRPAANEKMNNSTTIRNSAAPLIRTIKHMKSVKIAAIKHFSTRKTTTALLSKRYSEHQNDKSRKLDHSLSSI